LLGDRQPDPQPTWINHLDARLLPWLSDHRLAGAAVLAAYIEMAAAAVREFVGEPIVVLEEIVPSSTFLPEGTAGARLRAAPSTAASFKFSPRRPCSFCVEGSRRGLFVRGACVFRRGRRGSSPRNLSEERDPEALYRG
jgi:hypothetical protein